MKWCSQQRVNARLDSSFYDLAIAKWRAQAILIFMMNQMPSVYRTLFTAAAVLSGIVAWLAAGPVHSSGHGPLVVDAPRASQDGQVPSDSSHLIAGAAIGAEDTTPAKYASQPENSPGLVLSEQLRRAFAVDGAGNREKATCHFVGSSKWSLADPHHLDVHTRCSLTSLHIRLQV